MAGKLKKSQIQVITVSAIVVLAILLIAVIGNLVRVINLNNREKALLKEIDGLRQQYEQNDDTLRYYNSDAYIERYAREHLNMIKDGEVAYG